MTTWSKHDLSIDLFNLPPLPDSNKQNTMEPYLDVPNNYYIPDGKNSRLLDCVERREFERKTIDGNEGIVLQIPFLKHVFSTKYFIVDKQNGSMMGIFNDKLKTVSAEAQMRPFNLAQLSCTVTTLEQCRQGFNESSVAGSMAGDAEAPNEGRLQYPSTPKDFKTFDSLKQLEYDGNMLTPEERSGIYWDHTKVIAEMADATMCFLGVSISTQRCQTSTKATLNSTIDTILKIIHHIDIFLQEDQLMHTN